MSDQIRVFIGTDVSQMGASQILKLSVEEYSSLPVQVEFMDKLNIPVPKDARQTQRTGFSFARWAIPELCGYKGKAIYVDADMMVFTDIKELWDTPMNGATIAIVDGTDMSYCSKTVRGNKNETSVMVIDCEKADWSLEKLVQGLDNKDYDYGQLMGDLCFIPEDKIVHAVPRKWNAMDYWDNTVGLLHYTNVPTQPWVYAGHPYAYIWVDTVKRYIQDGKITLEYYQQQVDAGHFRPSLLEELTGETYKEGNETYLEQLREIDRVAKYVPHRSLIDYTKKREKAIRAYELNEALRTDFNAFLKLSARHAVNDLKGVARKILRRA